MKSRQQEDVYRSVFTAPYGRAQVCVELCAQAGFPKAWAAELFYGVKMVRPNEYSLYTRAIDELTPLAIKAATTGKYAMPATVDVLWRVTDAAKIQWCMQVLRTGFCFSAELLAEVKAWADKRRPATINKWHK